jgi:carbon-monoxide dehydrogenase small subunit
VPLAAVDGASITTVEALGAPDELSPVQAAFDQHYAAQCGFCTSGFVLAATALLERKPDASREDVLEALSGHVCRCTGYVKIVNAVEAAARGDVHPEQVEPSFEPEEAEVLIPGSPA